MISFNSKHWSPMNRRFPPTVKQRDGLRALQPTETVITMGWATYYMMHALQ